MTDYFTKKDAEEFKEDFQHFLNLLFSGNRPKLRYVMDTQMNLRQQFRQHTNLDSKLIDKMNELSCNIMMLMKEHGNLVVAELHLHQKLDDIEEAQKEIKQMLENYRGKRRHERTFYTCN
jgi:hypothetical protein